MTIDPGVSDFVSQRRVGSLATIKRDGRAQLSNVGYTFDADTLVRMSLTDDRVKVKNLRRDPGPRCSSRARTDGRTPFWRAT